MKPIRGGLLSALVAALLLLALSPATSWATYPGANGLIAYSETREYVGTCNGNWGYNWEIFTISPTGGEPTRLTDNATSDEEPSWSADGQRLAFVRRSATTCRDNIWTMRADGTHQRQITHGGVDESSPSFSPGGGRIVMVRNGDTVTVSTDGTKSVRLTRGQGARNPVFSPDGRRIVFNGEAWNKSKNGIWSMRRDGTHKRLLAREYSGGGMFSDPDFDPDGSHIVFERCSGSSHGCDTDNVLMRSNGRRQHLIGGGEKPVFSPNGTRIAGMARTCDYYLDECATWVISYSRHGGEGRYVTEPGEPPDLVYSPSWQPIPGG
jgi:Tol biopolymer transport system component